LTDSKISGILQSDFMRMRRRQLLFCTGCLLLQDILILIELVIYFAKRSAQFNFGECESNWFSFTLCVELLPIELFLVAFWFIPRHFFLPVKEINRQINDLHLTSDISTPILNDTGQNIEMLGKLEEPLPPIKKWNSNRRRSKGVVEMGQSFTLNRIDKSQDSDALL
jgi:hypothetical protein